MLRALSFSGCLWYALDNSVPKRGKKMVTVHMTAVLPGDVQQVWTVLTGVEDYSWRSDLSRTEVLSAEQFVEHTQTGDQTLFTITAAEPGRRWELDMENRRMRGHWVGLFSGKGAETAIQFTETLHVKKPLLRPFVKRYLRKQQARFVADLRNALQARANENG